MADISVRVIDPANARNYVTTLPELPKYFDMIQHDASSPIIYVQQVIWTPGDAAAKVTVTVG